MESILKKIKVDVHENIYLKDPFSSDLGREIVNQSIVMMTDLGFEHFTFKKLSAKIGCTESAVYRYFENKHKLLLFLTLWYWGYLEQNLIFATANLADGRLKLEIAIKVLVQGPIFTQNDFIDPLALRNLLTDEVTKAFLTKEVDEENRKGYFEHFNKLGDRIARFILEVNPRFEYPKSLVSTLMDASLVQSYYSKHLPRLTEQHQSDDAGFEFFKKLIFKTIEHEN